MMQAFLGSRAPISAGSDESPRTETWAEPWEAKVHTRPPVLRLEAFNRTSENETPSRWAPDEMTDTPQSAEVREMMLRGNGLTDNAEALLSGFDGSLGGVMRRNVGNPTVGCSRRRKTR